MQNADPSEVELSSFDMQSELLRQLADLMPGLVVDGVLDTRVLAGLTGLPVVGAAADSAERFGLEWARKAESIRSLLRPSSAALHPDLEASASFEDASNVLVIGDNLEVLKLLQRAYNDAVKLVYIDPPYNTGSDFVYADDFADGTANYLAYTRQLDQDGNRTSSSVEVAGRRHSRWLSMMHPRLLLARNLLTQEGLIIIHIDENELARLILLLDEVFGPENKLGEIIWDKRNPKGDANGISSQHEYLLVYARSREAFIEGGGFSKPKDSAEEILRMAALFWSSVGKRQVPADLADMLRRHGASEEGVAHLAVDVTPDVARRQFARWLRAQPFSGGELAYDKIDDDGEVYRLVSMAWPNKKQAPPDYFIPLKHPVTGADCPVPARGWRNPPATMQRLLDEGRIVFGATEATQPQRKYLLRENMAATVASIIPYGGSDDRLLAELGVPFDTPKPVELIRQLVGACTKGSDLVLDFFAGSGSTAHAVALQNDRDQGTRRAISVNLPEPVSPTSEAARSGFETVAQITLKRLKAIAALSPSAQAQGLRVFELQRSVFRRAVEDDEGELLLHASTRVAAGDPLATAAEVLLAEGVRLDEAWREREAAGARVVTAGGVAVVLSEAVDDDAVRAALELKPRVLVFLEDAFAGADAVKANAVTSARNAGVTLKTV